MTVMRGFGLKCLVCALVGLALSAGSAAADESTALGGTGSSPLKNPLVVPEAQPLLGSEAVSNAEEARLASPEAAVAREESQTKFEGLDPEQAVKVAGEAFPALINELAGGPPKLPAGESIVGFPSESAAQIDLPVTVQWVGGHDRAASNLDMWSVLRRRRSTTRAARSWSRCC
ncbi:MAG: hypothetical protein ABSH36_02050, partial [Solirubrobacteraceae bacterium]